MMEIDIGQMKVADRLNGTLVNGYAGYYANHHQDGESYLLIAIPHTAHGVKRLMQEISLKV